MTCHFTNDLYRWLALIVPLLLVCSCGTLNDIKEPPFNEEQQLYIVWTEEVFRQFLDQDRYEKLPEDEKIKLETKWLTQLEGKKDHNYYIAINRLASIQSNKAIEPLLNIATEQVEKDNRDRWMAVRALGLLGDKSVVPKLIHLTYHYNLNTRYWAQISLVKLSGVNFGRDWETWGQWWNKKGVEPEFVFDKIVWTSNPEWADDGKYIEIDRMMIEKIKESKAVERDH